MRDRHIDSRRRHYGKRALAFVTGFASGALIALVTRALADENAGLPPFSAHAARHAMIIGLLTVAAALVAVAIRRRSRATGD